MQNLYFPKLLYLKATNFKIEKETAHQGVIKQLIKKVLFAKFINSKSSWSK